VAVEVAVGFVTSEVPVAQVFSKPMLVLQGAPPAVVVAAMARWATLVKQTSTSPLLIPEAREVPRTAQGVEVEVEVQGSALLLEERAVVVAAGLVAL
jgi:hypothetical protein